MAKRSTQVVLVISTLIGSWLGMQQVHELGHVIGAWLTGGIVGKVVLNPLTISRTDLHTNPNPLLVVWAGPVIGVLLPLSAWIIAWIARVTLAFLFQFFAGFCLIANGAYIAFGSFDAVGDCGQMLLHGSPIWLLWLFGGAAMPCGLLLWHGQGQHFGLGSASGQVEWRAAITALVAASLFLMVGIFVDGS